MAEGVKFIDPAIVEMLFQLSRAKKVSWRTFGIGVALATFANKDGECWPTRKALGERAGVHTSAITKAIRELKKAGCLTQALRGNAPSIYQFLSTSPVSGQEQNGSESPKTDQGTDPKRVRVMTQNGLGPLTQNGSPLYKEPIKEPNKEPNNNIPQKVVDLWNLNMGARIGLTKGNLKNIRKCMGAMPDFLEKYERAAIKFKGVDDSEWPRGKANFTWSLVLNKPDGMFYPVVDRVLDGVYDKKEKRKPKDDFEERYKKATERKDLRDG